MVPLKNNGGNLGGKTKRKTANLIDFQPIGGFFGDPAGARTQDPNIKSVVLYLLSYRVILASSF